MIETKTHQHGNESKDSKFINNFKIQKFETIGHFLENFEIPYLVGALTKQTINEKTVKKFNTHHKANNIVRSDYNFTHKNLSHNYWNKKECNLHNEWVFNKNLSGKSISVNIGGIPLINDSKKYFQVFVMDIDSKKTLKKFKESYQTIKGAPFDINDYYHSLSFTKKLPHIWCIIDNGIFPPFQSRTAYQVWGKDKIESGEAPDIDLISSSNVFEQIQNKMYGNRFLFFNSNEFIEIIENMSSEEMGDILIKSLKQNPLKDLTVIRQQANNNFKNNKKNVEAGKIRKKRCDKLDINKKGNEYKYSESDGFLHTLIKGYREGGEEKIPYNILEKLLNGLDAKKVENGGHAVWKQMAFGVGNQMTKTSNPYRFLNLFDKWIFENFDRYEPNYFKENEKLFELILTNNLKSNEKIKCGKLWKLLYEHNRNLWIELNFHSKKPLNPKEFCLLTKDEYIDVMKKHIINIKSNPPIYIEYDIDSHSWKSFSLQNFKTNYEEFIVKNGDKYLDDIGKLYHKNLNKTSYKHQDFLPYNKFGDTNNECPYTTFNLFDGFEIDKDEDYEKEIEDMTQKDMEKEIDFILTHIRNLCGEDLNDECFDYVLKYIAHIFKYPHILPRVALVFTSLPGFGKNQILNLIRNIIGQKYYVSTQNTKLLFDTFNALSSHKLLVNLNELSTNKSIMEQMKVFISEDEQPITKKYCETEIQKNRARTIIFSNRFDCLVIEGDDRRLMLMRSIRFLFTNEKYDMSCKANIERYNIELNRCVNSKRLQKIFYNYCLKYVNITQDYNFESNRILTNEYKRLKEKNISVFIKFVIWGFENGNWSNKGSPNGYLTPKEYLNEFKNFREFMGWGKKGGYNLDFTEIRSKLSEYKVSDIDYNKIHTEKWLDGSHNKNKLFHNISPKTTIEGLTSKQHKFKLIKSCFINCCNKNGYEYSDNNFIDSSSEAEDSASEDEDED